MKKIILIFSFIFIVLDINAQFQKIDKKMYNALMGVVHFLYHMVILIER